MYKMKPAGIILRNIMPCCRVRHHFDLRYQGKRFQSIV